MTNRSTQYLEHWLWRGAIFEINLKNKFIGTYLDLSQKKVLFFPLFLKDQRSKADLKQSPLLR